MGMYGQKDDANEDARARTHTERVKGGKKDECHVWTRAEKERGEGAMRMSKERFARRNVFRDRTRPLAVAGIIGNVISYIRYARLTERERETELRVHVDVFNVPSLGIGSSVCPDDALALGLKVIERVERDIFSAFSRPRLSYRIL